MLYLPGRGCYETSTGCTVARVPAGKKGLLGGVAEGRCG